MTQFKPHAMTHVSAKKLLIDDSDYSTPQDHYFGYINRRQGYTEEIRQSEETSVLRGLDLGSVIPMSTEKMIYEIKPEKEEIKHQFFSSQTGSPRHTKKDYEHLNTVLFEDIFAEVTQGNNMKKQVQFGEG